MLLNLLRSIIPSPWARALFLKGLRWASAAAAGALVPWLVSHGISTADASSIAAAVGALILAGGSALGSWLDARSVQEQQASTAHAVAVAPPGTQAAIASQASAALSGGAGANAQLSQTIAALKTGTF